MSEAQIKDGVLMLNIRWLMENITAESKTDLISYLACDNDILRMVGEQIIDGMTEEGWCGGTGTSSSGEPWTPIDKVRRSIVEALDHMAKREIEHLKGELASTKKLCDEGWERYHALVTRSL